MQDLPKKRILQKEKDDELDGVKMQKNLQVLLFCLQKCAWIPLQEEGKKQRLQWQRNDGEMSKNMWSLLIIKGTTQWTRYSYGGANRFISHDFALRHLFIW